MKKTRLLLPSAMALALVAVSGSNAFALPISGEIFFTGSGVMTLGGVASTPGLADGIDFTNPVDINEAISTGDYAGLPAAQTATFTDLTGADAFGVVGTTGPLSVNPLWTFTVGPTTYSFSLDTVTFNNLVGSARVVEGTGFASITGFDPTHAYWQLSTSGRTSSITFSSVTTVPDGGWTALLLGFALVGFEGFRRRLSSLRR